MIALVWDGQGVKTGNANAKGLTRIHMFMEYLLVESQLPAICGLREDLFIY